MKYQGLTKEGLFFLIAGLSAVFIDYFFYIITLKVIGPIISKILGFYLGVIISFVINSLCTFKKEGKKFLSKKYFFRYLILLSLSMLINVMANYLVINSFHQIRNITFLAFSFATFLSMIFNFIGMKTLVFK